MKMARELRPGTRERHPGTRPRLVVGNGQGDVFEVPELEMLGLSLRRTRRPRSTELIPLPYGSGLFELPDRMALAWDPVRKATVRLDRYRGRAVRPVAAFLAPAYTQIYRAAWARRADAAQLPLYAYTAVGWEDGDFWAAAVRVDADIRQDPAQFDFTAVEAGAAKMASEHPDNRLVAHLMGNCVRKYRCPAACNLAMGRWECPVPTSPTCNAACIGCLSAQPRHSVPPAQPRIDFVPTIEEIVAFTVPHLEQAADAIISFGQGCEGEPLQQAPLLEAAIREIRSHTRRGTINLNSNASDPDAVEKLFRAGLDSIRVSLNSAQTGLYNGFFAPRGYSFEQVRESMFRARAMGGWVSLNYFIFPGLSDHPVEMEALRALLQKTQPHYIQMRNLNLDPDRVIDELELEKLPGKPLGLRSWMRKVREWAPWIGFGYYNPPKERWEALCPDWSK